VFSQNVDFVPTETGSSAPKWITRHLVEGKGKAGCPVLKLTFKMTTAIEHLTSKGTSVAVITWLVARASKQRPQGAYCIYGRSLISNSAPEQRATTRAQRI